MTALNACLDFYSNDFSNPLTQSSYSHLSSILSTFESCDETQPIVEENDEQTAWSSLVEQHIYLPSSQPKVSHLKNLISKQLEIDYVKLCVDFYAIKNNNEDNTHLCEQSFQKLEDMIWKCNMCKNKSQSLNEQSWNSHRPKPVYTRDRNTGRMVAEKEIKTSMPQNPCSVEFLIDRINKLYILNINRISQIRHERAEKERLAQEALDAQAAEQAAQVEEAAEEPEWDHEPSSTQLVVEPEVAEEPTPEEPEPTPEEPEEPEVEAEPEPTPVPEPTPEEQ